MKDVKVEALIDRLVSAYKAAGYTSTTTRLVEERVPEGEGEFIPEGEMLEGEIVEMNDA